MVKHAAACDTAFIVSPSMNVFDSFETTMTCLSNTSLFKSVDIALDTLNQSYSSRETVLLMTLRNFHAALPELPSLLHHDPSRPNSSSLSSETAYRIPSSADATLVKLVETPCGSELESTENGWYPTHALSSLRSSVRRPPPSRTRIR